MIRIVTNSAQETFAVGVKIGEKIFAGTILALSGELGAGKTALCQGIACGLGVKEQIISPTFTLIHEYQDGRLPFYHMDMYRLEQESAFAQLGLEDYFNSNGIIAIEWAARLGDLLPPDHIQMVFHYLGEQQREILISYDQTKFLQQPTWLQEVFPA